MDRCTKHSSKPMMAVHYNDIIMGVSNHQPHDCLLNHLFRRRSKKTSKLRVTGLCAGNSPGTGEFPTQMASYAENVSIWWRHHGLLMHHWFRWLLVTCFIWTNDGLLLARYVDAMPKSEVTLVTIWYIHPPHHGHTKVNIMVINGGLTSLSFHANRPFYSWHKAVSNFKLQGQGHGCGQRERSYSQPSIVFASFLFHINQTNNFWDTAISKFDLEKSKSELGQRSRSHSIPSIHIPFCLTSIGPNIPEIWPKEC